MTRPTSVAVASSLAVAIVAAVLVSQHRAAAGDDIEVKLCDNQTTTTVPADQPVTHENGETAFDLPPHPFDFETLLDSKNFVPQPSAFFTREAYEAVSGVDLRYHYAMDYDLWVRIGRHSDVAVVDGILSCFRFQSESKSVTAADRFYPEMRKISRRNGGRFFSRMYMDRLPERRPTLFKFVIAYRLLRRGDIRALARRSSRAGG